MNITSVALKNLKRTPARTVLLLSIGAVVVGALFSSFLSFRSVTHALRNGTARLGADILVVPAAAAQDATAALLSGTPTHFLMDGALLARVRAVAGVEQATAQLFIKPRAMACCANVNVFLIAFDPSSDLTIAPWLDRTMRKPLGFGEIITGGGVPVMPGDHMPFYGTVFTVAGVMERTGLDMLDRSVFMDLETAYRMAEDSIVRSPQPITIGRNRISALLVRVHKDAPPDRVAIRIEHGIPGVKAIPVTAVHAAVKAQISAAVRLLSAMGVLLWGILLLVMAFAFALIIRERSRELGILRAMGATRRQLTLLLLTEASALSLLGCAAGMGLSALLLSLFRDLLLRDLKVPFLTPSAPALAAYAAIAACLALISGLLAALLPSRSLARKEPYMIIRGAD